MVPSRQARKGKTHSCICELDEPNEGSACRRRVGTRRRLETRLDADGETARSEKSVCCAIRMGTNEGPPERSDRVVHGPSADLWVQNAADDR